VGVVAAAFNGFFGRLQHVVGQVARGSPK
jgi:hypothetical protein